jgi:hypothetical protein
VFGRLSDQAVVWFRGGEEEERRESEENEMRPAMRGSEREAYI